MGGLKRHKWLPNWLILYGINKIAHLRSSRKGIPTVTLIVIAGHGDTTYLMSSGADQFTTTLFSFDFVFLGKSMD